MSVFKKIMTGIGILFAIAALIVGISFYATRGLVQTVYNQLSALQMEDIEKAYSYTSKEFQAATSLDVFKRFVEQYPALGNNRHVFFNHREISGNTGTIKGTLESKDGIATEVEYRLIRENNEWKILSIRAESAGFESNGNQADVSTNASSAAPVFSSSSDKAELPNVYEDKNNKYIIKYPADWSYEKPSVGTVLFRGQNGTPAYYSTVNVQTIFSKRLGGEFTTVSAVIDDLKKQILAHTTDVSFLEEGPIKISKATGKYFVFTYTHNERQLKQWQIVVFRDDGAVFYAWAYVAPVVRYDTDLPTAKAMIQSWSIY